MVLRYLARFVARTTVAIVIVVALVGLVGVGALAVLLWQAHRELPDLDAIRSARLVSDVVVTDRHGQRLAVLRRGDTHRELIAQDAVSPFLRDAVIASEDARFWSHGGIDPPGILRAFVANLEDGGRLQGGSTITQQLLKLSFLQGRPGFLRKIEEALVAARFESAVSSKEELLRLYLNAVYLGDGDAGVEAASRDAFGKPSRAVSLAEAALLVGRIPAPSDYSPFCAESLARRRQELVLRRMVTTGVVTSTEAAIARHAPVRFRLADDGAPPDAVQGLVDAVMDGSGAQPGDHVVSAIDLSLQVAATDALRDGLERYTRRRGEHRGPRMRLDPTCDWRAKLRAHRQTLASWGMDGPYVYDLRVVRPDACPPVPCRYGGMTFRRPASRGFASGMVMSVDVDGATLDLGDLTGRLPARTVSWAKRDPKESSTSLLERVAPVGSIVDVRLPSTVDPASTGTVTVELIPRPLVEGAVVVLDPRTREVLAAVGGYELARGHRNRAVHARRPIGSTAKPLVFGAGIAAAVDFSGAVVDASIRYVDPWSGAVWEPKNWYRGHVGELPVDEAMARSVNAIAVAIAFTVGTSRVAAFVEAFGVPTSVGTEPSIALGVVEWSPLELANAFATIASGGEVAPPSFLRTEPMFRGEPTFDAGLMQNLDWLLAQPVVHARGTAHRLDALELGIRGKTGTTNGPRDAWFASYTHELVVVVWIGYDQPAPLRTGAREESGGSLAVPIAGAIYTAAREALDLTPMPSAVRSATTAVAFRTGAPVMTRHAFGEIGEED